MNPAIELRMKQAQQIMSSKDPETLQYLVPAIKLIKSEYVENTDLEVTEPMFTFIMDTIRYLIDMVINVHCDSRFVTDCGVLIAQFILCIWKRIPEQGDIRNEIIEAMFALFENQKNDIGLCHVLFLFVNRLSGEVLRLPKQQCEQLCNICSYILSHSEQYTEIILSFALSLISTLIQLSENMEWFVKNGLIFQLATLFNGFSSTVSMCRYFVIILNQLAADESHIDELSYTVGFNLITNCIQLFAESANTCDSHHQIVELSFIYLLRIFVQDTKNRIINNQEAVTELICFLYEALYSPYYINITSQEQEIDQNENQMTNAIPIFYQTDKNVLMEYVMSLFALLCYNSDHPLIVEEATVNHICENINNLHNMNVVLFLHQFLYYCISIDENLISVLLYDHNLKELVENLHAHPSESLLTVFAKVIHCQESSKEHIEIINTLINMYFPSLLKELIVTSTNSIASAPVRTYSSDSFGMSENDSAVTSKQVSSKVQLITLDLLRMFSDLGYSMIQEDSSLIIALIEICYNYSNSFDDMSNQIVLIAATSLILIGKSSENFAIFENEPSYIEWICDLTYKSRMNLDRLNVFFNLLEQYASFGDIQYFVSNPKFVEIMRLTQGLLSDHSLTLQQADLSSDKDCLVMLSLFDHFCVLLCIIGKRLITTPHEAHPVLGEVFNLLETIVSSVTERDTVLDAVDACQLLIEGGMEDVKQRMSGKICESFRNGLNQEKYNEECVESVKAFVELFS